MRAALTIDTEQPGRPADAGNAGLLLDALARERVPATFFVQGRWAGASRDVLGRIVSAGHLVGNHTYYHAPLDLMTYLLTQAPGSRQLANEVANLLVVERRSLTDVQTVSIIHQERVTHPAAVEALRLMEANVSEPLTIAEIAQFAGMPLRSLQRLFRQQFAKSAERIYLDIRLSHARI